jgi:thiol-disulfide isomerase/thioredoxin
MSRAMMTVTGLVAIVVVAACGRPGGEPAATRVERANLDFTVKDMNGVPLNLASLKGRPVLINVWATYCGPCKIETPDLVALYDKYKDTGFAIVGISFDDSPEDLRTFAAGYKILYPILAASDRDDLRQAYETIGIPTSWFIRRDGTISETRVGIGSTDELEKSIRALL